jgi:uncharacterized membrane protein YbhN (UPF0104 family)
MRLLNALSAFTRIIDNRIGWKRLGVAVNILVICIAGTILFRLLRDIDLVRVAAAIQAMSLKTVLLASAFVAAGYVTLTFYDFFALRTIGRKDVPYRIAALASFSSYTIGHNLGATVLTGGAVRLRIYSAWGLGVIDVAKIAFVTGLTFWLGNVFVLGLAMACAPDAVSAVNQVPPWINRVIASAALAAIAGYMLWLLPRPRVIGRDNWQVTLPTARLTFVQVGIGCLDLGSGALAMYTLLPAEPSIDLVVITAIFVVATLLGFLSHAPGSLGVFDAAMLMALGQYGRAELLASLLVFRVLYFILPFAIGLLVLGLRELGLAAKTANSTDRPRSPM